MADGPPPMMILQARAEVRAVLFGAGEFTLGDALEPLERYAVESGLLDEFDHGVVDLLISAPFLPFLPAQE